jgi:hypothetical protein
MFTKAFNVWRQFDNGMLSDPEMIKVIETALFDAWSEGYEDAVEVYGEPEGIHPTPTPFSEYTLREMGEDDEFTLG